MELSERKVGKVTVIKVKGLVTMTDQPQRLSHLVRQHLEAGDYLFTINLAECERMDSVGIGELVKAYDLVSRRQGQLKLSNLPLSLRGVFNVAGLTKVIEVFDDEQAAINSFGN